MRVRGIIVLDAKNTISRTGSGANERAGQLRSKTPQTRNAPILYRLQTAAHPACRFAALLDQKKFGGGQLSKPATVKPPKRGYMVTDAVEFESTPSGVRAAAGRTYSDFKSKEHYDLWRQHLRNEKAKAEHEANEKAREAERARELRGCPTVLSAGIANTIRIDADMVARCENEPSFSDSCTNKWFREPPEYFFDKIFLPADLAHVSVAGMTSVMAYCDVRPSLSSYERAEPNRRQRGQAPPRKILVCVFGAGIGGLNTKWRRASYLARTHRAKIVMATVAPDTGALEVWFNVEEKSSEETAALLTDGLKLGADQQSGRAGYMARVPNSPSGQWLKGFEALHKAGLLHSREELRPRYLAVYWSPGKQASDKSLPTVPPKGRRA